MSDYELSQAPLGDSDVSAVILAMKQRLGVRTDGELATALGRTQGAVSHWRRKGSLPDAVLVDFNRLAGEPQWDINTRTMVAQVIALKLPSVLLQRAKDRRSRKDDWYYYAVMQQALPSVVKAIDRFLGEQARASGKLGIEIGADLFEDDQFLHSVAAWIEQQDWSDAMGGVEFKPPAPFATK